ncbi:MAG: antitoxin VapB family protein [Nanoarchaeota archaeon]
MVTTIQVDENTKNVLDKLKSHHRESYNELLQRLIEVFQSGAKREQLVETLEVISDPETMREIAESLEAYELGKGKSLKQLRKELGV